MNTTTKRLLAVLSMLQLGVLSSYAQPTTVYDSLDAGSAGVGYTEPSGNNAIMGDSLTLASAGTLASFGLTLFNSPTSGGSIVAGTTTVNFYDNTIPYTDGPISNPFLGTAFIIWDFTSSPLVAGQFTTQTVDLSGLNIVLPQNVLVTQQFNQSSGTSAKWGIVLYNNPIVGSSPNTVYLSSSATPAGLYTFGGSGSAGQVGYFISVTTGGGGNHRPVANPQNLSVSYDTSLPITLTATDADGDLLTYSIDTQPLNGTLSGAPPNVTYQPNFNYSGPDSFTFIANDGQTNSAPATISITVNGPSAGLIIVPVWDSTITSDPNAAAIENTINAAIQVYQSKFSDPVTVQITFAEMSGGLGQSSTFIGSLSYSSYYTALVADSKTTNDVIALAHLPGGSVNPADGTTSIQVTTANQRALGFNANPPPGSSDSTISLNMSIINIDRISINLSKFDLMAVVSHEIDEALGTSSGLPTPSNGRPPDLFRFTAAGARTYTTSGDDAWFSIDGGLTDLVRYNQNATGDYGDWWSIGVPHTPRVQDAAGTQGATPNLGVELTVLDVIGWDLVIPAPTPTIQSVTRAGNTINFSWASALGHGYQVQYKTNLTQVGWLNLNSPITAIGSVTSSSDTIGPDPRRFYRIALLTSSPAPPSAPLLTRPSSGPFTLVTNYFLPEQAAAMKGRSVQSNPAFEIEAAKPFKGEVRVQVQGQQ